MPLLSRLGYELRAKRKSPTTVNFLVLRNPVTVLKGTATSGDDRKYLEYFVVDNHDLERLEELLAAFNLFEAIGVVRQELKHSTFLAFLLDPSETHGLGDAFSKRFLKRALSAVENPPLSPIEVDVANLADAEVRREWNHIDILFVAKESRFVCAIENKIDSGEHSNQLARYREVVERHFPEFTKLHLYLTPDGDTPTDDAYISVTYETIVSTVEDVARGLEKSIGADLSTTLVHYAEMVKRRIMDESEIKQLCQRIYNQHKRALDLLFEYRPDLQSDLAPFLRDLHGSTADEHRLSPIHWGQSGKRYIAFGSEVLDQNARLAREAGWDIQDRVLEFEFENGPSSLDIRLKIMPGPDELQNAIYRFAKSRPDAFRPHSRLLKNYTSLLNRNVLSAKDFEEHDIDVLREKIRSAWSDFLETDLRKIHEALDDFQVPSPA